MEPELWAWEPPQQRVALMSGGGAVAWNCGASAVTFLLSLITLTPIVNVSVIQTDGYTINIKGMVMFLH